VTHSTIQNPRTTTTLRPSTQAHAKQTHTQIGPEIVNPSHAEQTQAISFFLAMENRGRERRTEGVHSEEKEKKWKREKEIEQNERERKKKKKKGLNRPVKNNKKTG
jgi:L-rhamnose mutarotase